MSQNLATKPTPTPPISDRAAAADLCERLRDTAARMADLLAEETALLKMNSIAEVIALQERKRLLSSDYVRDYCNLRENARFVGANVPGHVDRLKRTLRTLGEHADANIRALEAIRAVSHGLLTAIHDIARTKASGPSRYTSSASIATGTSGRTTAIAVDRAL
jgi:hypothetical protein